MGHSHSRNVYLRHDHKNESRTRSCYAGDAEPLVQLLCNSRLQGFGEWVLSKITACCQYGHLLFSCRKTHIVGIFCSPFNTGIRQNCKEVAACLHLFFNISWSSWHNTCSALIHVSMHTINPHRISMDLVHIQVQHLRTQTYSRVHAQIIQSVETFTTCHATQNRI